MAWAAGLRFSLSTLVIIGLFLAVSFAAGATQGHAAATNASKPAPDFADVRTDLSQNMTEVERNMSAAPAWERAALSGLIGFDAVLEHSVGVYMAGLRYGYRNPGGYEGLAALAQNVVYYGGVALAYTRAKQCYRLWRHHAIH